MTMREPGLTQSMTQLHLHSREKCFIVLPRPVTDHAHNNPHSGTRFA
jgi:hypothetical protein